MIIELSPEAKEYILKKKADAVTVSMVMSGGWGGFTFKPAVNAGEPRNRDEYDTSFFDDIKIYISRSVNADRVSIFYRPGFFGIFGDLGVAFS